MPETVPHREQISLSQCFEMLESVCNTAHIKIHVMSLHSHTTDI